MLIGEGDRPRGGDKSYDWRYDAACQGEDTDIFFPEESIGTPIYEQKIAKAKKICAPCPVRLVCRDYARSTTLKGEWGGETPLKGEWGGRRAAKRTTYYT